MLRRQHARRAARVAEQHAGLSSRGRRADWFTGADDRRWPRNAIELGAFGYLPSRFGPNELMINIVNALHRRRLELENRATGDAGNEWLKRDRTRFSEAVSRLAAHEQELRTHQARDGQAPFEHMAETTRLRDGTPSRADEQLLAR